MTVHGDLVAGTEGAYVGPVEGEKVSGEEGIRGALPGGAWAGSRTLAWPAQQPEGGEGGHGEQRRGVSCCLGQSGLS